MPKKVKNTLTPIGNYIVARQEIEKKEESIIINIESERAINEADTTNKRVHVIVESVGEDVKNVKVGDDVIFNHGTPMVILIEVEEGKRILFTENDVCAIKG